MFDIRLNSNRILSFVVGWLLILIFLPVVGNNLPGPLSSVLLGTYSFYLLLVFLKPKCIKSSFSLYVVTFSVLFHFIAYRTFWSYIGSGAISSNLKDFRFMSLGAILLSYFHIGMNDNRKFGKITLRTMIFVLITCTMTIIASIIDSSVVRRSIGGDGSQALFSRFGVGGYGFATLLVILTPSLIYLRRIGYLSRRVSVIVQMLVFVTLLRMQIFAAILGFLVMGIFSLGGVSKLQRSLMLSLFILVLGVSIPRDYYANMFEGSAKYFDRSSNIYFKLNDTAKFIRQGEVNDDTSAGMKTDRYNMLYEVFSDNPIMGGFSRENTNYWYLGFHFYWMYRLASYGIVGLLLFASVHFFYIRYSLKMFNDTYKFYFLLSCSGLILMGILKNLAGREMWVGYFVLLHGVYYIPLTKGKK